MIALFAVCWLAFAVGTWKLLVSGPEVLAEDTAVLGGQVRRPGWRGGLEAIGGRAALIASRVARQSKELEANLAVMGETTATFYGEKVVGGLIGLVSIPLMGVLGVRIPLAAPWSLAMGVATYFLPNGVLVSKARQARQELRDGVAEVAVLISLGVSGGAGVDAAFAAAVRTAPGRFAREVAEARAAHPRETLGSAVEEVADRFGILEAVSLASALGATQHGAAVGDALDELAWSMVETRRAESIALGAQARTRMSILGAGLMVPGYAALLILPGLRLALQALRGG